MRFLSVCSGIEAASVAWNPLGWEAVAFSEIEPLPCSVLAHRYPTVPNWGDMTKFQEWPDAVVDLLCGGTPCQSFSTAGLRKGLSDPRGNLMLTYLAIAARYRPRWLVWENVPGVLSSWSGADETGEAHPGQDEWEGGETSDFSCFLAGLEELGYGWAYRSFDAQFAGLAQRRERVFVVGCLGDWRGATAVLLERHGLHGHPAPSRKERARAAVGTLGGTSPGGGWRFGPDEAAAGQLIEVAPTLTATYGEQAGQDYMNGLMVAHALTGEGFDASEDGTGRGTPLVPVAFDTTQITSRENRSNPQPGDPCHTLAKSAHAPAVAFTASDYEAGTYEQSDTARALTTSADRTRAAPILAFSAKDYGADATVDMAPTLRAGGHADSHANAGVMPAVLTSMRVRRLTPRECERLQGFPDDYTLVPHRGKLAADGPRYKAIGNSWAVPCARWIGERIEAMEALAQLEQAA